MLYISPKTRQKFDDALTNAKSPWRRILICGIPGFAVGVYSVVKVKGQLPNLGTSGKVVFSFALIMGFTLLGMIGGAILELMDRTLTRRGIFDGRAGAATLIRYIWISLLIVLTAVVISVLITTFFR